ncbi:CTP synthase [Penicillium argentinense]|uniref:CTP synthase n=1 Tax=Penicillium argentinense TaxID=1131581 RepID=A0A9W9G373_9EURO|nr:CTP synthase [Penicillium argentinense]KAJ5111168.1 CTP synthase [Penicillium argentinense]
MYCRRMPDLSWVDSSELSHTTQLKHPEVYAKAGRHLASWFLVQLDVDNNGAFEANEYARSTQTPFLGIAYDMQNTVVELAHNVGNMPSAVSAEHYDSPGTVIYRVRVLGS